MYKYSTPQKLTDFSGQTVLICIYLGPSFCSKSKESSRCIQKGENSNRLTIKILERVY